MGFSFLFQFLFLYLRNKIIKMEVILKKTKITNSIIKQTLATTEENLNIDIVINDEDTYYFYDAVKEKLIKMKENVDKNRR